MYAKSCVMSKESRGAVDDTKHRLVQKDYEVTVVDIIKFFSVNSKFIGLTTAIGSAIAVFISLQIPKQYQKQLVLSVKSLPTPVIQSFPKLDTERANVLALEFMQNLKLDRITVKPKYNANTQKIDLALQSSQSSYLSQADSQVLSKLKTSFQAPLKESLENTIDTTQVYITRHQQILANLERQIAQLTPNNPAKTEALEKARADYVAGLTSLEFDKQYLQQTQKNLPDFTNKFLSIKILNTSVVQQTRSPRQLIVLAIASSFMLAVVFALLRNQYFYWQAELSKNNAIQKND